MAKDLMEMAKKIPSQGGREIGHYLRHVASHVSRECDIVEVGSWLGAGTAQLCLGIQDGHNDCGLHIFDRFTVNKTEVKKAKIQGVKIKCGQDTLPIVQKYIQPFKVRHKFYKTNITSIKKYSGRPIGMYIDDAAKKEEQFEHVMKLFKHHFIPGVTILILMDFFFFEWKGDDNYKYQFNYMQDNEEFEFIERVLPDKSAACYLYKG